MQTIKSAPGAFRVTVTAIKYNNSTCPDAVVNADYKIRPQPVAKFGGTPRIGCQPLTVYFRDSSDVSEGWIDQWDWDFGDGTTLTASTDPNPVHTYLQPGTYTVKLTAYSNDVKGSRCSNTVTYNNYITVRETPIASFAAKPTFTTISLPRIEFENYTNPRTQQMKWLWNFGDGTNSKDENPIHNYEDTGIYTVKLIATNQYGCKDDSLIENYINIRPEIIVYIPNAFTPNQLFNDRTVVNERFAPVVTDVGSYQLQIFSRWGELLYETTDKTKGWDGTFHGNQCQEDVYVYVLHVSSYVGKKYKYTGNISLLR
ncbi:MAG: PKD domain-containing protein [Bacteroidetes bacterium]|nr:PKD domain-containing protein [Bacteroidota bacterium]